MRTTAQVFAITIDCADPASLAEFYQNFLGGNIQSSNPNFFVLAGSKGIRLDFQRTSNPASSWPERKDPRRLHLDIAVDDIDQAEAELLNAGASLAAHQPGEKRFRVLIDPAGHPFCIAQQNHL